MPDRQWTVRIALLVLPLTGAAAARAETLYFKNKRTLEVSAYQIKGAMVYVTLRDGRTVPMRADSVDWEGTQRIKSGGVVLQKTSYEAAETSSEAPAAHGPAARMTAADLRKSGGFKLQRSGAPVMVIELDATRGWTDSRIDARPGQAFAIQASGKVTVSPGVEVGPEGISGATGATPVVAEQPFGALLARVGLGGQPIAIGASGRLVATTAGRLFFSVNDKRSDDNFGTLNVRVELPAPAGTLSGGTASTSGRPAAGAAAAPAAAAPPAKGFVGAVDRARSARTQAQGRESEP